MREGATARIYLRRLNELESTPVADSEGGQLPFFSHDGVWLGFTVLGGDMYKVPVAGGERTFLARGPWWGANASWDSDDRIVADGRANFDGLALIDVAAQEITRITAYDSAAGESSHLYPEILPDGSVLFGIEYGEERSVIGRTTPGTGSWEPLGVEGSGPLSYLQSGHLVFQRAGATVVAPFDLTDGAVGSPVPVLPDADPTHVDVSPGGTAAYVHFPEGGGRTIIRVDRDGDIGSLVEE